MLSVTLNEQFTMNTVVPSPFLNWLLNVVFGKKLNERKIGKLFLEEKEEKEKLKKV